MPPAITSLLRSISQNHGPSPEQQRSSQRSQDLKILCETPAQWLPICRSDPTWDRHGPATLSLMPSVKGYQRIKPCGNLMPRKKNDSVNLGISGTGQILRSSLAIQLWAFFETPNPYQPDVALVLSDRKARFKFSLRCAELGCWHSSPEFIGAVGPWTGKVDNM